MDSESPRHGSFPLLFVLLFELLPEDCRAAGLYVRYGKAPAKAGRTVCEPCDAQRRADERAPMLFSELSLHVGGFATIAVKHLCGYSMDPPVRRRRR